MLESDLHSYSQVTVLLLDVNMGQKILVRLRLAHAPDAFLDQEDVVQTMLHEASPTIYVVASSH